MIISQANVIHTPVNASDSNPTQRTQPVSGTNVNHLVGVSTSNLLLTDLSLYPGESAQSLVSIPGVSMGQMPGDDVPEHPPTADIHGLDYFKALGDEIGFPINFRAFCRGRKMARCTNLNDRQLADFERKLRYVAHRLRVAGDQIREKIELCAAEAESNCSDRSGYFIDQMFAVACMDELAREHSNLDERIFNLGVSFFNLDLLRSTVSDLMMPHSRLSAVKRFLPELVDQEFGLVEQLEVFYELEWQLKDRLGLPTNPIRPQYGAGQCPFCQEQVEQIAKAVEFRLIENDGEKLFDFMGAWEPWVKVVEQRPNAQAELDLLREDYTDRLALISEQNMPEDILLEESKTAMDLYASWKQAYIGQEARKLLINSRANHYEENYKEWPAVLCEQLPQTCSTNLHASSLSASNKFGRVLKPLEELIASIQRGETPIFWDITSPVGVNFPAQSKYPSFVGRLSRMLTLAGREGACIGGYKIKDLERTQREPNAPAWISTSKLNLTKIDPNVNGPVEVQVIINSAYPSESENSGDSKMRPERLLHLVGLAKTQFAGVAMDKQKNLFDWSNSRFRNLMIDLAMKGGGLASQLSASELRDYFAQQLSERATQLKFVLSESTKADCIQLLIGACRPINQDQS